MTRRYRSAFDVEVPGQHKGTSFRCKGCGADYGCYTLGCKRCKDRHGARRRKGALPAALAPTRPFWGLR